MCLVCQHSHKHYCYCYCYWLWYFALLWKGGEHQEKVWLFSSSFRDQEVGIVYQQQARKHLHGIYLARPFLLEKKPGSLVGISEWSFHNFESSSESVCLCQCL